LEGDPGKSACWIFEVHNLSSAPVKYGQVEVKNLTDGNLADFIATR